ncbi:MAG TPA: O-antigen ligase family protein, partial [Gammaproteobacteria bacterium]|nr:O-antigen ligase family protein [Gammaproteobacteria bacterium]
MSADNSTVTSLASGPLRYAVIVLVLAFPSVCLLVNRGDSIGLGLLALIGFWVGFRDGFARTLKREDGDVALAFFTFFVVAVLSYEFGQATYDGFRFLGRDLRFLLIVPVLVLFRRYPPPAKTVFIGLAIGGLLTGAYALVGFLHAPGGYRAQAETDLPIMFGDLTACIVLTMGAAYGLVVSARKTWLTAGFLLCLLFGLSSVILSGTRGAWMALLLLLPLLFGFLSRVTHKRYLALIVVAVLVLFAATFAISRTDVRSRLGQVYELFAVYRTALRTLLPDWNDNVRNLPFCDDQRQVLKGLLSLSWMAGTLNTEIVRDTALAADLHSGIRCNEGYAIRISASDAQYNYIIIPRWVVNNNLLPITRLLMRGAGTVYFNGEHTPQMHFDTLHYRLITVPGPLGFGGRVTVMAASGQTIWLVPVDSYFGEYRYTLMGTPVGLRLEMWRAAWHMFLDHPLLGTGTGAFHEHVQQMARRGLIAPPAAQYDHPHSDYF